MKSNNRISIAVLILGIIFETICFFHIKQNNIDKWNIKAYNSNNIYKSIDYETASLRQGFINPLYMMNLGCLYARADSINIGNIKSIFDGVECDYRYYDSVYHYISGSYLMFPEEPIFALNYSLVLILKGDLDSANDVLRPFANNPYTTREVMLVYGLINEFIGNSRDALSYYSKAIARYSDITDSQFFFDLRERDSVLAELSMADAVNELMNQYDKTQDPLVAARLGKMYYSLGDLDSAEIMLNRALAELPSLNRSWYYMGCIREEKGDMDAALEYYMRSYKLDEGDLLPVYKLVENNILDSGKMNYIKRYSVSNQSYRMDKIFGGMPVRFPYIVSDLEQYFSYCQNKK